MLTHARSCAPSNCTAHQVARNSQWMLGAKLDVRASWRSSWSTSRPAVVRRVLLGCAACESSRDAVVGGESATCGCRRSRRSGRNNEEEVYAGGEGRAQTGGGGLLWGEIIASSGERFLALAINILLIKLPLPGTHSSSLRPCLYPPPTGLLQLLLVVLSVMPPLFPR
ncbi:hypothetical protein K438DRAFT_1972855 [Mycena galopus ATCC 62051]|nr:hypothetical protein K438DRAFT_1972855 [Mycena galopus ATCC 62051]